MKILGLDYGEKRIGVAISDELAMFAHPFTTLDKKDIGLLTGIIEKERIDSIVVGMPLNLNGSYSQKAKEVLDFVKEIKKSVKIPVFTWDERFSTKEAERALIACDVSRKKRKKVLDKSSARVILQGYLDYIKAKKDV